MGGKPWLEKFRRDFKDKRVLILGLGLLGRGAADARFLAEIGAQVMVTDLKEKKALKPSLEELKGLPLRFVLGKHRKKDILNSDLILRNAAVPINSAWLNLARKNKVRIEMDGSLFAQYAPVKIIGITGTRGKSTTTTLIYQILKKARRSVWLAGNIRGRASLPLLEKINQDDWVVMELSSWQLQAFRQAEISPQVSLVTSIFEDHLNRYPSMKAYLADKKAIFQSQAKDDLLFLNKDSALVRSFAQEAKSQIYWFGKEDFPAGWQLKLKGGHNRLNAAGAIKLTQALGIKWPVIKKAVEAFSGLPHRLETAAEINGIQYVNDSTSTTPAAGIAALNSFRKPIVLIAGGNSKKLAMEGFAREIVRKAKQVVFLEGDETDNLLNLVRKLGGREKIKGRFKDLKKAVYQARRLADLGEVILLSPGCTSFGTFANEFDRGEKFKKTVKEMEKD